MDSSLVGGTTVGTGKNELPKVFESVSEDKDGVITVTLTNNSLESSEDVDIMLTNEGDKYSVSEADTSKVPWMHTIPLKHLR